MVDKSRQQKPGSQITPVGGDGSEKSLQENPNAKGNGAVDLADIKKLLEEQGRTVQAQGAALVRVIQHLNATAGSQQQSSGILTQKERRDLAQQLTSPDDELLPAFTDVSPLMATLIPAMNVIRWNYTPMSERPINPVTKRPYGMYLLWELDFARWSLSKNAHNAIRLCDVVQTRPPDQGRMGMVAE